MKVFFFSLLLLAVFIHHLRATETTEATKTTEATEATNEPRPPRTALRGYIHKSYSDLSEKTRERLRSEGVADDESYEAWRLSQKRQERSLQGWSFADLPTRMQNRLRAQGVNSESSYQEWLENWKRRREYRPSRMPASAE